MTTEKQNWLKRIYWQLRNKNGRRVMWRKFVRLEYSVAAYLWRRLLFRTTFIAVSGSVGKTTTKEILAAVLGKSFSTHCTSGTQNVKAFSGVEKTILKTRPWHRFAVIEIGLSKPGDMWSQAKMLRPDIAVMLAVKQCHTNTFRTLEAIAKEKSTLFQWIENNGYAVINQDDPLVVKMPIPEKCRKVGFGSSPEANFRLLDSNSKWPSRLVVNIQVRDQEYAIPTRLVGTHWSSSILAALSVASIAGISMKKAIESIKDVEPFWARMQPITLPSSNATIIRDDWNGSIDTFEAAFKVLEEAQADRRIVVFSDFSDSKKKLRVRAKFLGKEAARVADAAIFIGDYADRSADAAIAAGLAQTDVHSFMLVSQAIDFLKRDLRDGDLVLIKGQTSHHLSRVYLGLIGDVTCDLLPCSLTSLCDRCPDLGFKWEPRLSEFMAPPWNKV